MAHTNRLSFSLIGCLSLALLLLFGYWRVWGLGYVWDDHALFVDSAALRHPDNFWLAISHPILPGTTYFRPLVLASFVAEFQLFGAQPEISHIVNLAIHWLNCVLVFLLALKLCDAIDRSRSQFAAITAAIVYGIHPALIEPVTWVAGRFDLLVTTFVLCALLAASNEGWIRTVFTSLLFLAACFSKEMAATFPILLVLWWWALKHQGASAKRITKAFLGRRYVLSLAIIIAIGCVYLVVRYLSQSSVYHVDKKLSAVLTPFSHVGLVGQALLFYLKSAIFPFIDLNPMHPFKPQDMAIWQTASGIVVLVAAAFVAGLIVFRKSTPGNLMLLAAVISLLPVLHIVPLTIGGNIGHERFLTLPLAFIALAISAYISRFELLTVPDFKVSRLVVIAVSVWVAISIVNIRVTVPLWTNDLTLWLWAYKRHPDFNYVRFSLIMSAIRMGKLDIADRVLKAIPGDESEEFDQFEALRGHLLQRQGQFDDAIAAYEKSLSLTYQPHVELQKAGLPLHGARIDQGSYANAWYMRFIFDGLAESYIGIRRFDKAIDAVQVGKFYQPEYAPAYLLEAFALYGNNEVDLAKKSFSQAMELYINDETRQEALNLQTQFLKQLCQKPESAIRTCSEFQRQEI